MKKESTNQQAPVNKSLNDPRWPLVQARDASANGQFYYSVKTTGVYCRPSCPSRTAKPENVQFHVTTVDAERAGFRPCRRCNPDQPLRKEQHALLIERACRCVEQSDTSLSLKELAAKTGMSPFHFHRTFKALTGLTPKAYEKAHREKRVRNELKQSRTVTQAIYDAGYNAQSRFYEQADAMLGMTPSRYRSGGHDMQIRFAIGECSLGAILVAVSDRGVCAISMGDNPERLVREFQDRFFNANLIGGDHEFENIVAKVVGFVEAPEIGLDLPLDIQGTAFQKRVWQALQQIPVGSTVSYTDIANRIGAPKAVRAVAGACAANNLAVAIPCHRVVRNNGNLSGYRWGIERKHALLLRESALKN